jgi:hypothetical protein
MLQYIYVVRQPDTDTYPQALIIPKLHVLMASSALQMNKRWELIFKLICYILQPVYFFNQFVLHDKYIFIIDS